MYVPINCKWNSSMHIYIATVHLRITVYCLINLLNIQTNCMSLKRAHIHMLPILMACCRHGSTNFQACCQDKFGLPILFSQSCLKKTNMDNMDLNLWQYSEQNSNWCSKKCSTRRGSISSSSMCSSSSSSSSGASCKLIQLDYWWLNWLNCEKSLQFYSMSSFLSLNSFF